MIIEITYAHIRIYAYTHIHIYRGRDYKMLGDYKMLVFFYLVTEHVKSYIKAI